MHGEKLKFKLHNFELSLQVIYNKLKILYIILTKF